MQSASEHPTAAAAAHAGSAGAESSPAVVNTSSPASATPPATPSSSVPSRHIDVNAAAAPTDAGTAHASAGQSSALYKLYAQHKDSLLAYWDGTKRQPRQPTASPSTTQPPQRWPESSLPKAASGDTRQPTSAADASALPPGVVDEGTLNDFFSYLALPGTYTEADTVIQRHAAQMGVPDPLESSTDRKAAAVSGASAAPSPPSSTSCTAASSSSPAAPSTLSQQPPSPSSTAQHIHRLQPTQFFVPTLCEVCRRAVLSTKVWPPPSPDAPTAPGFFSKLLSSPVGMAVGGASDATGPSSPTPSSSSAGAASSGGGSAKQSATQQPFLGFGSEGYHCDVCNLALHRQCLPAFRKMEKCELFAPAARHMHTESNKKPTSANSAASKAKGKDGEEEAEGNSLFTWDSVKSLLGSYLDPSGDTYSRKDANVKVVLSGVYALLDIVAARYPDLSPMTLVKRRQALQDLSCAHQTLYADCATSLADSRLLASITWEAVLEAEQRRTFGQEGAAAFALLTRELHPLCMDTSLFSQLTSTLTGSAISPAAKGSSAPTTTTVIETTTTPSAEEKGTKARRAAATRTRVHHVSTTGPAATFPVQLLLWRAMRYATAVYGEVYRRGSLSSTVSAALLFTVNRGSVEVSKSVNDAAVTSVLELPPSALKLSRWGAKATEPSYVLLLDHAVGHIVVAFRGTLNTFDIMTDLAAVGVPFCGGYAHQGAAHVVNALIDHRTSQYTPAAQAPGSTLNVKAKSSGAGATAAHGSSQPRPPQKEPAAAAAAAASDGAGESAGVRATVTSDAKVVLEPYALTALETPDGLLDGIEQLAAEYPSYTILITGHSLGGGVAVLLATRLHHDRVLPEALLRRMHVIAFAPMPTLSLPAASCFDAASCEGPDGGFSGVGTGSPGNPPASSSATTAATGSSRGGVVTPSCSLSGGKEVSAAASAGHTKGEDGGGEPQPDPAGSGGVRQACFPVWNVVNGFDCVPRLQVNTIDRLIRHIVGPQAASGAGGAPASASTLSSRAVSVTERQRGREELRDAAWVEMRDVTMGRHREGHTTNTAAKARECAEDARVLQEESEVLSAAADSCAPAEGESVKATPAAEAPSRDSASVANEKVQPCAAAVTEKGEEPAWANAARTTLREPSKDADVIVHRAVTPRSPAHSSTQPLPSPSSAAAHGDAEPRSSSTTPRSRATSSYASGVPDLSHELHHPGRVLLLTAPWDTTQNRLVDVPRGHPIMHELFLMKSMLLQHAGDAYLGSLAEVHCRPSS